MSGRAESGTLEQQFQDGMRSVATRFAITLSCLLLVVTIAIAGMGFLIAALYLMLAERLAPTGAAALVGGLLLAIALLALYIVNWNSARASRAKAGGASSLDKTGSRQHSGNSDRYSSRDLAASLGAAVGEETGKWTQAHPFSAMAAALAAGIAVGASPQLSSEIEQLIGALSGKGETTTRGK